MQNMYPAIYTLRSDLKNNERRFLSGGPASRENKKGIPAVLKMGSRFCVMTSEHCESCPTHFTLVSYWPCCCIRTAIIRRESTTTSTAATQRGTEHARLVSSSKSQRPKIYQPPHHDAHFWKNVFLSHSFWVPVYTLPAHVFSSHLSWAPVFTFRYHVGAPAGSARVFFPSFFLQPAFCGAYRFCHSAFYREKASTVPYPNS